LGVSVGGGESEIVYEKLSFRNSEDIEELKKKNGVRGRIWGSVRGKRTRRFRIRCGGQAPPPKKGVIPKKKNSRLKAFKIWEAVEEGQEGKGKKFEAA